MRSKPKNNVKRGKTLFIILFFGIMLWGCGSDDTTDNTSQILNRGNGDEGTGGTGDDTGDQGGGAGSDTGVAGNDTGTGGGTETDTGTADSDSGSDGGETATDTGETVTDSGESSGGDTETDSGGGGSSDGGASGIGVDTGIKDSGTTDTGSKDTGIQDTGCTYNGIYPTPSDPKDCSKTLQCGCGLPECPPGFSCNSSNLCENSHCHCSPCSGGYVCNETTGYCEKDPKYCTSHSYCETTFGSNYYCAGDSICREKLPCSADADCADRPEGQKCNTSTKACVECLSVNDCTWKDNCTNGDCVAKSVNCSPVDYDNLGAPYDVEDTDFTLRMVDQKAEFFAEPFPDCHSDPNGINTSFVAMNQSAFISGGAGYFSARFSGGVEAPGTLYIGIKGELGFWRLPLSGGPVENNIILVLKQGFRQSPFTFNTIARDTKGNWGKLASTTVEIKEAGGGPLQVSVLWQTKTDVDLHLEEPSGFDIYYGCNGATWPPQWPPQQTASCESPDGGKLDIDSNAACNFDDINNENIFYGGTPPSGKFIIRVDYWSSCDEYGNTDFIVTLWKKGHLQSWTDKFSQSDSDGGSAKSGRIIYQFNWP